MGWIARLFGALVGKKPEEPEAPESYKDTVKIDMSDIKQEKSLGAEVHEWLDETQSLKDELDSDKSIDESEEDHTRTVPSLKESDLPDLDKLGGDDEPED